MAIRFSKKAFSKNKEIQKVEKNTNNRETQKEEKYTNSDWREVNARPDFPKKRFPRIQKYEKKKKYTNNDWRKVDARPDLPTTFSKPFLFATLLNRTKSEMDVLTPSSLRCL